MYIIEITDTCFQEIHHCVALEMFSGVIFICTYSVDWMLIGSENGKNQSFEHIRRIESTPCQKYRDSNRINCAIESWISNIARWFPTNSTFASNINVDKIILYQLWAHLMHVCSHEKVYQIYRYNIIIRLCVAFCGVKKFRKCEWKKYVTAGDHFHSMTVPKMNLGML